MHPTTPRNDATTTENIRFPIPPPKPCASMRAQEDEVKAALGRQPITGGWDPGRPNEPPLLLLHPPHDATATENVSVPSLQVNPRDPWLTLRIFTQADAQSLPPHSSRHHPQEKRTYEATTLTLLCNLSGLVCQRDDIVEQHPGPPVCRHDEAAE